MYKSHCRLSPVNSFTSSLGALYVFLPKHPAVPLARHALAWLAWTLNILGFRRRSKFLDGLYESHRQVSESRRLLLAWKLAYPEHMHLARGNHEDAEPFISGQGKLR